MSKQHPSVKKLNRPDLAQDSGNDADYSREHITGGPEKTEAPLRVVEHYKYLSGAKPKGTVAGE